MIAIVVITRAARTAAPSSLVHTPTAHRMGIAPSYLLHPMALGSFAA
jgi:hypothetical protein